MIYVITKDRPFSWSAKSSFDYDPEQWYEKYCLGIKQRETAELLFGKRVGEKLASNSKFMKFVPRLSVFEHPFRVDFDNIPLIGFADSFCGKSRRKLFEYKTGVKKWDQKRVDKHGQIDMYLLMLYLTEGIRPEEVDVCLVWLPTQRKEAGDFSVKISFVPDIEKEMKIFKTKRTMQDILKFGINIKKTYSEMQLYAKNHK